MVNDLDESMFPSGVYFAYGGGVCCGEIFGFNPDLVPSVVVAGTREPICPACVAEANRRRPALGLAPIRAHPLAYQPAGGTP